MIRRIAILKACCIGDVVLATPLLRALRRAYPDTVIDWFVGSSAIGALHEHPDLTGTIDCGRLANPASRPVSLLRLVTRLSRGRYDLVVVPDRSRLSGLAVWLAGIRQRAGLDSEGRGARYTIKALVDPDAIRHEAEIYLDIARCLQIPTEGCWANIPPQADALRKARDILDGLARKPLIVVHPGGGVNAGMHMIQKRWPADRFASLADRIAEANGGQIVVVGARTDQIAIDALKASLKHPPLDLSTRLSLPEIGALASIAAIYLGNDNGVAHLAAASGGKVLMIFGPSDPRRYAPFVPPERARFAWRPVALPTRGVSSGAPFDFDWERDGISVDEVWTIAADLLRRAR